MSKKPKDTQLTGLDGIQKTKVGQDYTDKELVEMGSRLAQVLDLADRLKSELDETTIRLHARIECAMNEVNELAHEIRLGFKWVEVDVKAEFDTKANLKKLYTFDGEFLREEKMTDSDHQIALPIPLGIQQPVVLVSDPENKGQANELPAST